MRFAMPARLRLVLLLLGAWSVAAPAVDPVYTGAASLQDLYFGEALYHAYREDHFAAIVRLDVELAQHHALDEPERDSLVAHRGAAEFDVGDFELRYRMYHRAGRAIERVVESETAPPEVRNRAVLRLARLYYARGDARNALFALDRLREPLDPALADAAWLLRAQADMQLGDLPAAVAALRKVRGEALGPYARYNLGVALMRLGRSRDAVDVLDAIGRLDGDPVRLALADKANLSLGNRLLEAGLAAQARPFLDRVRLHGPFANKGLLLAGWAAANSGDFERALVPWTELTGRDPADIAVQEGLLALPYAYAQLGVFGRAALLYGEAVNAFSREIDRLDGSIQAILDGRLRQALLADAAAAESDFLRRLRDLPDAPETRYLLELMAGHVFQAAVANYRDLARLYRHLERRAADVVAFQDLVERRRAFYTPRLPEVERRYQAQDALLRSVRLRRDTLARRLRHAQQMRDPRALASGGELKILRRLARLRWQLERRGGRGPAAERLAERIARLEGVVTWRLDTEFDTRLDRAYRDLAELDALLQRAEDTRRRVERAKRAAYQSFEGYALPFNRMTGRLAALAVRAEALMAQQAQFLEKAAVRVLDQRRKKLVDYRVKARFALAESYDLAIQKQAEAAEAELRERQRVQEIQVDEAPAGDAAPGRTDAPGGGDAREGRP